MLVWEDTPHPSPAFAKTTPPNVDRDGLAPSLTAAPSLRHQAAPAPSQAPGAAAASGHLGAPQTAADLVRRRVNLAGQRIINGQTFYVGIDLINQIKLGNPQLWTSTFKAEIKALFEKAVERAYRYAEDTLPRAVPGLDAAMFKGCLRCSANLRATQIGLEALFPDEENPFPWMSEMIDLKKERNFFETRVIGYPSGGALSWE